VALSKIQYKIGDSWVHFCYVEDMFKDKIGEAVEKINRWAQQDFGIESIKTMEDLANLKERIKSNYRELYPELFRASRTDNQGWARVWFTQHLREELKNGK